MRVATLLKHFARDAELNARSCLDADQYTEEELFAVNLLIAELQNRLGDVQEVFTANGRKLQFWNG